MRKIVQAFGVPFALIAASLGFCFLVLELGLRVVGYDPMGELIEGRSLILRPSEHPLRIFEFTPNTSGSAWRSHVRINSHGMRDREYPISRSTAPRIAVLGDSVAFGSAVAAGDRFSDQLESLLAERLGERVEVLNFAVGGYDTVKEVATLEHVGLAFEPDLVVLAYCVNDLGDNSPNLEYIRSLENLDSRLYRLRTAQLLRIALDRLWLIEHLVLDNRDERFAARHPGEIASISGDETLRRLRAELQTQMETDGEDDFMLEWYLSYPHLGRLEFALDWLEDLASEHDLEVIVAILPFLRDSSSYEIVYRMVEHMASQHSFESVKLAPRLAHAGLESLQSGNGDAIHPNERGHRLIAEALEPVLARRLRERAAEETDAADAPL